MGKALKMSLIILILLVVAVLAMPKSEKAFEVSDNMVISGGYSNAPLNSPYKEEMRTLTSDWSNFSMMAHSCMILNKFVFCIEERQHLPPTTADGYTWFNCTWKVTIEDNTVYQYSSEGSRTELTGDKANFTIGFAYILSNMENFRSLDDGHMDYSTADPFNESSGNFWKDVKPYQREIWSYLNAAKDYVSGSNSYWFGKGLGNNEWHSDLSSSQMQIVKEALKIAEGNSDINIEEAEFYVLESGKSGYQRLVVVKKSTSDDPNGPGGSDNDSWSDSQPTKFTGKVWVEGQNGDKDINVNNKNANNIFDSGIDNPLEGVEVSLSLEVAQYEPIYDDGDIMDYKPSGTRTINPQSVKTNGVGEYSFSIDLTTHNWSFDGESYSVSEYITGGTVTFKYNGVSYIQAVSYTHLTLPNNKKV